MNLKGIFLISVILVCLSLSVVSATDLNNTQVIETSSIPVDVQNNSFQSNDYPDNKFLGELQEKINNALAGSVLDVYTDYDDYLSAGLTINKDLTIDGHGHKIDRLNINGEPIIHSTNGNIVLKNFVICNSHNDKSYKGGAIFIEGTAKYTIENCTFSNNWADDYGAAIYNDGEKALTIKNSYFKSNIVDDDDGGAIFSKASVDIENSMFEYNSANDYGGAIYCEGNVNVCNSLFRYNNAIRDDGGAIFSNGNVTISKSKFEKNKADDYGGAIYANYIIINSQDAIGPFTSSFIGNEVVDDNGGALYSKNDITIVNTIFDSNKAKVDGGAVHANGNMIVKHCLFEKNKAEGAKSHQCYGGAIRAKDISVDNSTFRTNHADDYGGAIYANNVKINDITYTLKSFFLDNDVKDDKGGAIYAESDVNVNFTVFCNNKVKVDGGAIYSSKSILVKQSIFENNKAEGASCRCFGGAIRAEDTVTIDNSTFSFNVAENHGGAVYAKSVSLLNKNFFIGNTATKGQGGAIWTDKIGNICSTTFMDNKAGVGHSDDGGAIYINCKDNVVVSKCIFINNHCGDEGGSIYLDSGSSHLTLKNNFFMGNVADKEGQNIFNCGYYDLIEKNWWGGSNPSSINDKIIEWKHFGSNVGHSDSNILLPIMINMVIYGNEPIIRVQEFFYTSDGGFVNDDIFDLNQISISSSLDAKIIKKEIVDNKLIVDLKPTQCGKYTITSDFYGYKITQEVNVINNPSNPM